MIDPSGLSGERDGNSRFEQEGPTHNPKVGFWGRILGVKVANASATEPDFPNTTLKSPDADELCYAREEDRIQQRLRQLYKENGLIYGTFEINDTKEVALRNRLYQQAKSEIQGNNYTPLNTENITVFFKGLFDILDPIFGPKF